LANLRLPPCPALDLSPLTHWIRPERQLAATDLQDRYYIVGLGAVVGRRHVLPADDLREMTGLWSNQKLILALYGDDDELERLWLNRSRVIDELAVAGYAAVLGPSYSIYENRPPSEWLLHAKRSYWMTARLAQVEVPAIPRGGWVQRWQMRREAVVYSQRPDLRTLSLDLGTLTGAVSWQDHLQLLAEFDRLTGHRVTYIINGPSSLERILDLYRVITPSRSRLLSSRAIAYPSALGETLRNVTRARMVWEHERSDCPLFQRRLPSSQLRSTIGNTIAA